MSKEYPLIVETAEISDVEDGVFKFKVPSPPSKLTHSDHNKHILSVPNHNKHIPGSVTHHIDFSALKTRCNSTSTPFVERLKQSVGAADSYDSGFDESPDIKTCLFSDSVNTTGEQRQCVSSDLTVLTSIGVSYYGGDQSHDLSTSSGYITQTPDDITPNTSTRYTLKHLTRPLSSSSDSDTESWQNKLCTKFAPKDISKLIGRKMGLEYIDVLTELHHANITPALERIMGYLSPDDLCRMCFVSKDWNNICTAYPSANERRITFQQTPLAMNLGVENSGQLKRKVPRELTYRTGPLGTVQKLGTPVSPVKDTPLNVRYQSFVKEGNRLKQGESLRKCPRCSSPSKFRLIEERGLCTRNVCQYDFCTRCLCEFHGSQPCGTPLNKKTSVPAVASKRSRTNLRRL